MPCIGFPIPSINTKKIAEQQPEEVYYLYLSIVLEEMNIDSATFLIHVSNSHSPYTDICFFPRVF